MNAITITGNMTKDPELRTVGSDLKVCTFSVAVKRPHSKDDTVDFIDCVAWRKNAEFISKYFFKGKPILVNGYLQSRKWQDKNGNARISWEINVDDVEFIGGEKKQNAVAPAAAYAPAAGDENPFIDDKPPFDVDDEELNALPL